MDRGARSRRPFVVYGGVSPGRPGQPVWLRSFSFLSFFFTYSVRSSVQGRNKRRRCRMVTKQTWQTADDSLEMAGKQCLPTEGSRTTIIDRRRGGHACFCHLISASRYHKAPERGDLFTFLLFIFNQFFSRHLSLLCAFDCFSPQKVMHG